ncbi:CRISPR-associated helicase Cas3' [Rhodothermus bifroesti]|uniref:CRISPR-associated helicase Cas3' n=1 Tax=Rhodothermus bifroesti TaxID=2823335 RepID=UPI001AEFB6CC|nr:CRISPR-associated helicase Cas3' [Rhodothermus bifroesti]
MSRIWAKSRASGGSQPVSLAEHTRDVLRVFEKLSSKVKDLSEVIRIAIVCHDLGKVLPAFQIRTLGKKDYEPYPPYHHVPHSLFSVLWINSEKLRERIENTYVRFVLSAVAYHHWREGFSEWISSPNQKLRELCEELQREGVRKKLQENLKEEIRQLEGDWQDLIDFNVEMAKGLKRGVPFSEYASPPYQLYWLPKRAAIDDSKLIDWVLISGFLMRSDHFASFCEEEGEDSPPEVPNVASEKVKEKVKAKIGEPPNGQIWQLQALEGLQDKNVILVAPTGYGKTEFAFLWASGEKFFYTLPLRAAVNQIFERAKRIFGDDKVGLLHSDADVYLLGDGGEAQASLKSYDLARQLAYPVLVSTGDQFFPYALRPPGYEKIYATFSYSRLVIDEVQAYDPRAAAIIVKFMEDVVRMGGKFLLMTATLPKFVREEIDRAIGEEQYNEHNLYEERKQELKQFKKHFIEVELIGDSDSGGKSDFTVPEDKLEAVLQKAKEGNRVLVIANTVKQAQDIFQRLKKLMESKACYQSLGNKLWLLHSQFTQQDREEKEQKLMEEFRNPKPDGEREGKILVATQVVEASLDMDADVLFTEIAPLDALVQRMGRVWRRYGPSVDPEKIPKPGEENPNVYIWIFKQGLHSGRHYVYDLDLVLLSIKLFYDLSLKQKNKDEAGNPSQEENYKEWLSKINKKNAQERIDSVLKEVFSPSQSSQSKSRSRRGSKGNDLSMFPETEQQVSLDGFKVTLSEYDKFDLVKKLYDLPDEHDYLVKFRQAKDILDAGYMSDRLKDAQKMFREIYTVSVIPEKRKEDFSNAIREFLKSHSLNEKRLYTSFKREVLSKFVVSLPGRAKQQSVEGWVRDLSDLEDTQRRRLLRWCRDIYFAEYEYNHEQGIIVGAPWGYNDAAIL